MGVSLGVSAVPESGGIVGVSLGVSAVLEG